MSTEAGMAGESGSDRRRCVSWHVKQATSPEHSTCLVHHRFAAPAGSLCQQMHGLHHGTESTRLACRDFLSHPCSMGHEAVTHDTSGRTLPCRHACICQGLVPATQVNVVDLNVE